MLLIIFNHGPATAPGQLSGSCALTLTCSGTLSNATPVSTATAFGARRSAGGFDGVKPVFSDRDRVLAKKRFDDIQERRHQRELEAKRQDKVREQLAKEDEERKKNRPVTPKPVVKPIRAPLFRVYKSGIRMPDVSGGSERNLGVIPKHVGHEAFGEIGELTAGHDSFFGVNPFRFSYEAGLIVLPPKRTPKPREITYEGNGTGVSKAPMRKEMLALVDPDLASLVGE